MTISIQDFLKKYKKTHDLNIMTTVNEPWLYKHTAIQANVQGALSGKLIAIKDNINVKGLPNTCGSNFLKNYIAPYDATVIERIKKAGGTLVGKTNLDEFAMGSSTEYSAFGATKIL